jgi:hypothetical protein
MLARSRLTSLGFTVAPDARHPFGTGNCCVFFQDRTFIEPVTIVDRTAADIAAAEGLFFVKRVKRFTERHGEGFAMVALKCDDAEADRADFESAGIAAGPVFRFTRMATLPDGSQQEIGFALAYAENPSAPDATFFACQHLAPGALFQPAYLEHPNGAAGIVAVVAVAPNPGELRDFLSAAIGEAELSAGSSGLRAAVDGQSFFVLTPGGFRERYGLAPPEPRRGLLFAAIEILVADLERAVGYAGPTAMRHDGRIVVPASPGLAATLAFRTEANA